MFESDQSTKNEWWCPFMREWQRHMYHRCHMRDGTYLWRPRYSSSGWQRETRDRYMGGSALCSNVGFPSSTIVSPTHLWNSAPTSQSINHTLNIRFAHFSFFEYPSNTRKVHGRKTKQKVEVHLSRKSIDYKEFGIGEEGLDVFGRDQVVTVIWAARGRGFSILEVMMSMTWKSAKRHVRMQSEWIYEYETLFAVSEKTRRLLLRGEVAPERGGD